MARFDDDVAIIGSGFGGSVAALRAAEKGYRVGDVQILLRLAPRVGEERPVAPHAVSELVGLEEVIGRDGDQAAIAHLHLARRLQESLVLPPVLRTEATARQHRVELIPTVLGDMKPPERDSGR